MTLTLSIAPSADPGEAVNRIEGWLLRSGVQIDDGDHRGGVAGWLDRDGRPEFVYPEIVGYYLTAMAWLSGAASSSEHVDIARLRARRATTWIADVMSNPAPPTRLYLSGHRADWRNAGVFSFDLAMAARGIATARPAVGRPERRQIVATLCAMIDAISSGADVMRSHELVAGNASTMPDRWSTRPGPHHLKSAAAILRLPDGVVGDRLIGLARRTCDHWSDSLRADPWSCLELHAVLYGLEGMLIRPGAGSDDGLRRVERLFVQLMEVQASDGTLPETVHGGTVRSDVLAQALRVGLMLRGRQYLTGPVWTERLDRLTDALLEFVQPDGAVLFSFEHEVSNTWCAMFAHQALYLRSREGTADPVPATAFELLV